MRNILCCLISLICITNGLVIAQDSEFLVYSVDQDTEQEYINLIWDYGLDDNSDSYIALVRLIEPLINNKDYQAAVQLIEDYRMDFGQESQAKLDKLVSLLKTQYKIPKTVYFGDYINSSGSEYSPMPTADGNRLYFTGSDRSSRNESEDIFYSEFKGGRWTQAKPLEGILNTPDRNEAPQAISVDGNTMILFGAFDKSYFGKGDLYYSDKTLLGWGEPKHFPNPVNTEHFDADAKYTADRKNIIFVSDRPGGIGEYKARGKYFNGSQHGNTDIYVAEMNDDGSVDTVINLGEVINTPFAERKPFLHPDGKTLYFSSDGHPGYGRLDLYMSKRLSEDSWTEWSEPVNMGIGINSPYDESGSIVTTFGEMAYFATQSREINYGKSDIYSIELPDFLKPEPIAGISGNVKDINGFPLGAKIVWEDLETGEKLGEAISDPKTGEFYLVLELGTNYGIVAEKEGYFPISNNINLKENTTSQRLNLDLEMQSIDELFGDDLEASGTNSLIYDAFNLKSANNIRMNNLFFAYNESTLLKESFSELDRAAYLLNNYPVESVDIEGHTDSIGGEKYNKNLSEARAKSVVEYLASKGVEIRKMTPVGYGMERPVAPNDTEENRQKNRRVELQIHKKGTVKN